MGKFSIGAIPWLLVTREGFQGFDRPPFVSRTRLLGDGGTGPHEILQSSGVPARTAEVNGYLTEEADLDLLREYDLTKEPVAFTDGKGETTIVRVLDLTTSDYTDWWSFAATLVALGDGLIAVGLVETTPAIYAPALAIAPIAPPLIDGGSAVYAPTVVGL